MGAVEHAEHERRARPLRVGVIGRGAIGSRVVEFLEQSKGARLSLSRVVTSRSTPGEIGALIAQSDLVVEAAGHEALVAHGPRVLGTGVDLLVVSVGALVDDALMDELRSERGGRILISSGAIGGLDLLKAAALLGPLDKVSLETRKRPAVLLRPWMSESLTERLQEGREAVEVLHGSAREAARRFPESANAAATLGLATVGLDATEVTIIADPAAEQVQHRIRASGAAGAYEVSIRNQPSPDNPRTSGVVPYTVVRALQDLTSQLVIGI